jgi:hypothetical protein
MQVAVAGVRDTRDGRITRSGNTFDARQYLRHGTDRHADVLSQLCCMALN